MGLRGKLEGKTLSGKINKLVELRGYSAYEVAVLNGFEGTEEEWLASLKGPKGDPGTAPAPVYLVEINGSNNAEQSYADRLAAYQSGYVVQCDYRGFRLPLKAVVDTDFMFSGTVDGTSYHVVVRSNGNTVINQRSLASKTDIPKAPVTSVNRQIGEVSTTTKVNLTKQTDGSYLSDLSAAEIMSAYKDGNTVHCYHNKMLLLLIHTVITGAVFSGIYDGQVHTVTVDSNKVATVTAEPLSSGGSGTDGITPHIGDNGNWFIGETDTGMPSRGEAGKDGTDGQPGADGSPGVDGKDGSDGADGITPHIGDNGNWFVGDTDTGKPSRGADGQNGYTPQKGIDYFDGQDGAPGKDGNDGKDGSPGKDGEDGQPGKDGASPSVAVSAIAGGHRITITDVNGTKTFDVLDGSDGNDGKDGNPGADGQPGKDGQDGIPGKDGVSPTVTVSKSGKVTTVTISDANGTKTATINDGADGQPGKDGADGQPGYTPQKGKDYFDGAPGKTPVKGVDYWTAADQEAIVQQVITALGTPVFGSVDADNNIVLTGNLADGTYTLKYEDAEGNVINIGTLTTEGEPTWTNVIPLSINTDGSQYVGDNGEDGYKAGCRINSSYAETAHTGASTTGFIPVKITDTIYFYNMGLQAPTTDTNIVIALYDANFTGLGRPQLKAMYENKDNSQLISEGLVFDDDGMLKEVTPIAFRYWVTQAKAEQIAYIRVVAPSITVNSVITLNEPIE